jgi:7,8-dihydropterin-6-yl-methyl-4-(beta-D-ribofuranosyl)aminobenzene 5'-phosphate synthase
VRITTVVDNMCGNACMSSRLVKRLDQPEKHFVSEQGFSMLVQTEAEQRVLIDAGGSELVFLHNLKLLNLEPKDINAVVITHGHYDHVGGLVPLIEAGVPIFAHPRTFVGKRYSTAGDVKTDITTPSAVLAALPKAKLTLTTTPLDIFPGIKISGEVPRTNDFEQAINFLREEEGKMVEDPVVDEQAVYIQTKKGLVIISGCAHPGIVNIVQHAKKTHPGSRVHMVLGGFHLSGTNLDRIRKTMDQLKNFNVDRIAPMHCSGFEAMKMISDRFVGFELMPAGCEIDLS